MVERRPGNPGGTQGRTSTARSGAAGQATGRGGGMKGRAAQGKDQVQQKAGEVKDLVATQATDKIEAQKATASESLTTVAQVFRHTGQQLRGQEQEGVARYIDQAAERVEHFADYLGE